MGAMRFSSARIRAVSKKIAAELIRRGAVSGMETRVSDALVKAFDANTEFQDRIDEEVKAMLAKNRNLPPPGTQEYKSAFEEMRRIVAARKGFR